MKNSHIIALLIATVFILIIAMQMTIYNALSNQQEDISVVNYSGRQRMLSQNIVKIALQVQNAAKENLAFKDERLRLKNITNEFIQVHQGLVDGNEETGLTGRKSPTIERMLEEIEQAYEVLSANALQLTLENKEEDIKSIVEAIVTTEESFLTQMDAIVNQYELEARQQRGRLQKLIILLSSIVLLFLGSMILFVVRPYLKKITDKRADLSLTNQALTTKYREFDAAKTQTETKNRQLQRKTEIYSKKVVGLEDELLQLRTDNELHKFLLDDYTKGQLAVLSLQHGLLDSLKADKSAEEKTETFETFEDSLKYHRLEIDKIHEFLSLSRGEIETNRLPFDIKKVVKEVQGLLVPKIEKNQITFNINTSTDLPDTLIGDENYLGKALFLLLDNAVNPIGGKVTFDVFLNHVNENYQAHIDFAISDSSRYILEENFDELFNLTHLANSEKFSYHKLDIAIAQKLLKLLGSHIRIDSSEASGTTFYFSLTVPIESPVAESYYKIG